MYLCSTTKLGLMLIMIINAITDVLIVMSAVLFAEIPG